MSKRKLSKRKAFSIFRTAQEEAEGKIGKVGQAEREDGHMSCIAGRIVSTPGGTQPFKAIMSREDGSTFECAFGSMEEAEAFVRRNTPRPQSRSTTYDHDVG
jgi:hypothetical protein